MGGETLTVWVADQAAERHQGLREIEELPTPVDGMLFVYGAATGVTYGMLNTPMPLDIWWFDAGGVLIDSNEMAPCETEPCTAYGSPGPVRWVLETPLDVYQFDRGTLISNVETG